MQSSFVVLFFVLFSAVSGVTVWKEDSNSTLALPPEEPSNGTDTDTSNSTISYQHLSSTFSAFSYNVTAPLFIVPEPYANQPFFTWPETVLESMEGAVVLTSAASCVPFCFYMARTLSDWGALGFIIGDDSTTCDQDGNDCGNRALALSDADPTSSVELPVVGISMCAYEAILEWGVPADNETTNGTLPLNGTQPINGTDTNTTELELGPKLFVLLHNADEELNATDCPCEVSSSTGDGGPSNFSSSTGSEPCTGWWCPPTGESTGVIDDNSTTVKPPIVAASGPSGLQLTGGSGMHSSAPSPDATRAAIQALTIMGIVKLMLL